MNNAQKLIEEGWENRTTLSPQSAPPELRAAVEESLDALEQGTLRVAQPTGNVGEWLVNEWLKKAVLLSFRLHRNEVIEGGFSRFFDKVPLRWGGESGKAKGDDISQCGARIVPPATVRRGAFIGRDAVLMPSYVNIGAWVGAGTMVDTWATVGSCAQIGAGVHLSGGVGIGGVLEPLQATPTIIEDDCFIGARSEVVEGVIVERGSVISMGVFLGQSTKIYDRATGEIHRGRVPAGSVVVPGSLPAPDGSHSLYCAVIVKRVDEATRARTSVNEILRDAG
jgi:2,3,4,5-tetrahydropyridine-2-carboxylate N-succinyltransferase